MKRINVFIKGSYDYKSRIGIWTFYLEWNGAVMKRSGSLIDAQSNVRITLYALIQAIDCINEPCILDVHTKLNLGFKTIKKSKNADLIRDIQHRIIRAGHLYNITLDFDDKIIEKWERLYGNKDNQKKIKDEAIKQRDELDKNLDEQRLQNKSLREMYDELMSESNDKWIPGMGGY